MERIYILDELDCANCAMKIERHVGKIKGVKECSVDFVSKRMFVDMEHEGIEAVLEETVQAIKTYFGALSPVRVLCSQFLTLWIACALPMAVELLGKWLGMEILSWILYLGYAGFDAAVMAVNGKPLLYASLFISPADYLLSAVPESRFLIPICICAVLGLIGYLISEKREFLRKE